MTVVDPEIRVHSLVADGNYTEAFPLLVDLSEKGSLYSSMVLGWMYENGVIGHKDIEKSQFYYEKAAAGGDGEAHLRLGAMLVNEGATAEARAPLEAGVELGNLGCKYYLGIIELNETSLQAQKRGLDLIKAAAEQGHIFSRRKLISIEIPASNSPLKWALLLTKVLPLTLSAFREALRDRNSNRVL